MRIVFVVEQYLEEGTRYYRELFRLLGEEGVEVHVVNLAASELFDRDVEPFVVGIESLGLVTGYRPSVRLLRSVFSRLSPDLIHAMETIPAYYSARALIGTSRWPALVYHRHHSRTRGLKSRVMDMVAFWCADRIVAVSESMAQVARSEHPIGAGKVICVYNGITTDLGEVFADEGVQMAALSERLSGRFVVLLLARMKPGKGHDVALEALALVREECPDLVMLLVGGGPIRDGLERNVLTRGLGEEVRILGRVEDISSLMSLADVMIVPSLAEAFGLVAVEGMSAGLPVVASDVGGLSEIFTHRKTGMLVPPGNPQRLADTLGELCRDPELRKALGRAARREYRERFTPQVMAAEYLSLYRELTT